MYYFCIINSKIIYYRIIVIKHSKRSKRDGLVLEQHPYIILKITTFFLIRYFPFLDIHTKNKVKARKFQQTGRVRLLTNVKKITNQKIIM